ncbi:hypothetical protein GH714_003023 [Hevea brasiliensis]|uniref:tRNA ligase phosphodiesterase domain-containing protein n=1 Tax=Hevea brasiliensis TaxID=3981 RepID=A0A6A6N947_HEVBR|nr:hypothetical protein GH714_003023 [Hevea brasiliensis]
MLLSLELGIFLSKPRREIIQYIENTSSKKIVNLTLESDQATNDCEQLDDELNLRQSFGEYKEEMKRMKSRILHCTLRPHRTRSPLPDPVRSILEEGINLYRLHTNRHGRLESTKGSYAKEWANWEKRLREVLFSNAEYLNSIQVPFESAVKQVLEQLRKIAKGEYTTPIIERRKLGTIVFAAIDLPVPEICSSLNNLAQKNPKVEAFLQDKHLEHNLKKTHLTLAHKRSHGVTAVASYGLFLNQNVPVELTALLFTDKMAALEAQPGSVDGEKVVSKNEWPHVTIWTAEGVAPKEANTLPQLFSEGKATRVEFSPPITISGTVQFY